MLEISQKRSGKQKMILLFYVSLYTLLDKTKFYKIIIGTKLLVGHYFSQLPKIWSRFSDIVLSDQVV